MLTSRCASSRSRVMCVLVAGATFALLVAGCGGSAGDLGADEDAGGDVDNGDVGGGDAHADVGGDARDTGPASDSGKVDGGGDAKADSGTETASDSGSETSADSGIDTGIDSGVDVGTDSGSDSGVDTGTDTGVDTGCVGGTPCGPSLGGCVAVTVCIGGVATCVGTFVAPSPTGASGNPGTQSSPLDSIDAAIANATLIGGGADVCVCATGGSSPATYSENVTMVEGTSVLGGHRCSDWSRSIGTYVTRIQDVDADGVNFPAGITSVTALDGMTVNGQSLASGTSTAITVTDASPTLVDDTVFGQTAPTSIGLAVLHTSGVSSPTITRGAYTATASSGGTQIAVVLDHSTATINSAAIGSFAPSGAFTAATTVGLRCIDCGATSITGGSARGGGATGEADGMWASGDVTGFKASGGTTFNGGNASGASGVARGIFLDTCTGASTFTSIFANGGGGTTGERVGMDVTGVSCAPSVSGGALSGCEVGPTCIGLRANASPVIVSAAPAGTTGPTSLFGAGSSQVAGYGVRCLSGGCSSITNTSINAGGVASTATIGIGADIVGASPTLDSDNIRAPSCGGSTGVPSSGTFLGLHLQSSSSTVTNDVVRDQACATLEEVVRFDKVSSIASFNPVVVNETIEYTSTASSARHGIAISGSPASGGGAAGIFDNDIVRNLGSAGTSYPVYEYDVGSDPSSFDNNDLYDPTAAALFYLHGTTPLATIVLVNTTVPSASANISANPNLTATWHLNAGSPCIDAGTSTSAPKLDFDLPPDARPYPASGAVDIGADEWHP